MYQAEKIFNQINIFAWAKDKSFKYIFSNENNVAAAGLDSPEQIIGKKDEDLPWKEQSNIFCAADISVMKGNSYINVQEFVTTIYKTADILVSKSALLNQYGECIGTVGSYIDITGKQLSNKSGHFDRSEQRFYLGKFFGNEYFTLREFEVFKFILLGYPTKKIANLLKISCRTVEGYLENIKLKLQCSTRGDIIAVAIRCGLIFALSINLSDN